MYSLGNNLYFLRLRHNVIKTGVKMISLSYSKISLDTIAQKLQLDSAVDAEFIVAKVNLNPLTFILKKNFLRWFNLKRRSEMVLLRLILTMLEALFRPRTSQTFTPLWSRWKPSIRELNSASNCEINPWKPWDFLLRSTATILKRQRHFFKLKQKKQTFF